MIEVRIIETGDTAEAKTPEAAVFAARTIGWEAVRHERTHGFDPTIVFSVDGGIVRTATLRALNR